MFQVLTHSVADLKRWVRLSLLVLVIMTDNCSLSLMKKNQKKLKKDLTHMVFLPYFKG